MSCVFCEIVENRAPAVRLFEDDLVVSFLDVAPINAGHALVIPKVHHSSITTVPEAVHGRMMQIGAKLGVAMQRELDADGFNLHLANGTCAGQIVIHTHLHVIPRFPTDGFAWGWRSRPTPADAEEIGRDLNARLAKLLGQP